MANFVIIDADNRRACKECPLNKTRTNQCIGVELPVKFADGGSPEVLIVGSTPGEEDDKFGRPMTGKGGHHLRKLLKDAGLSDNVAYTSAVRCFPGRNSDKSLKDVPTKAVEQCKTYLHETIEAFNPKLVVALGNTAIKALGLGEDDEGGVYEHRLRPVYRVDHPTREGKKLNVTATFNPSYVLRNPGYMPALMSDICDRVPRLLEHGGSKISSRGGRKFDLKYANTVGEVSDIVDHLLFESEEDDLLAIDYETANLSWRHDINRVLTIGLALTGNEKKGWAIPYAHPETPFSPDDLKKVRKHLRRLFASKDAKFRAWIAHNAEFEHLITRGQFGLWLGRAGGKPVIDTMIMAYLLDENRKQLVAQGPFKLETLAEEFMGFTWYAETGIKDERDRLAQLPIAKVLEYVGIDAVVTVRLYHEILDRAASQHDLDDGELGYQRKLLRLAVKLYSGTVRYTAGLKRTGQLVDIDMLRKLRSKNSPIVGRLREIERTFAEDKSVKRVEKKLRSAKHGGQMQALFGEENAAGMFSLTKNRHLQALFFDEMGLEPTSSGKSGPSVGKVFQKAYMESVPLVSMYNEHKSLSKLDQAYLKPIANFLQTQECDDGRVHPSFHLTRAVTGRASASDPNSQQMPRSDSDAKRAIKCLFKAPDDHLIVQLDFSQAEVRWLGVIADDPVLAKRYEIAGEIEEELKLKPGDKKLEERKIIEGDIHMMTALTMFNLPMDLPFTDKDKAKKARQSAKSVCFGLIYGKGAKSLAAELGMEVEEAEKVIKKWLGQFPQAAQWLFDIEDFVVKHGYVESPLGRRRRLPEVFSDNPGEINRGKRQARNSPIQGAASDTNFYASAKLMEEVEDDEFLAPRVGFINVVHDANIAQVHVDAIDRYTKLAHKIFTDRKLLKKDFGVKMTVPLAVDFDAGPNWGAMKDYKFTEKSLAEVLHDAEVMRKFPAGTAWKELEAKGLLLAQKMAAGKKAA